MKARRRFRELLSLGICWPAISPIFLLAVAFVCSVSASCGRPSKEEPKKSVKIEKEKEPIVAKAPVEVVEPGPPSFALGDLDQDEILRRIRAGRVRSYIPIGGSSASVKVIQKGISAIFKPATIERPGSYRREVAAYRLARALGLDNVPPAVVTSHPKHLVEDLIHPDFSNRWSLVSRRWLWTDNGFVRGASALWLDGLAPSGIETNEMTSKWTSWLMQSGAPIVVGSEALAADISNLLVFDYLIGNWDRFSGGNIKRSPSNGRLFFIDHNAAFGTPMHRRVHEKIRDRLMKTQKFSKQLVERLQELDTTRLKILMREETGELLGSRQIADVLDRKETILSYIQSLTSEYGEEKVLRF